MVDIKIDITPEVNIIIQPLQRKLVFIHSGLCIHTYGLQSGTATSAANVCKCTETIFSSSEWNNLFWTSSLIWLLWQETDSLLSLSLSPNKETNRKPNKPVAVPLQCSHPHPGRCQVGEIIGIVYPHPSHPPSTTAFTPPPNTSTTHTYTPPIFISHSSSFLPTPPSSSPLQNEMPVSDRLSQFADPCGTLPFRPGHCASRSLAKRRGIIFIPQTRGYAPMISNACLAHCQGWFWPCAKPIILISFSLYFNSHRQCKFTAEHIREIKISLRL